MTALVVVLKPIAVPKRVITIKLKTGDIVRKPKTPADDMPRSDSALATG